MGSYANPFAPVAFAGLMPAAPDGTIDKPFVYPYDVTLTSNQTLLNQSVPIMTDADFYLRGIYISTAMSTFSFRWSDSNSYFFSAGLIASAGFSTFAGQPFPVVPEIFFPAGGKIGIDIQDTSGSSNAVEICFAGVKRFKTGF